MNAMLESSDKKYIFKHKKKMKTIHVQHAGAHNNSIISRFKTRNIVSE